MLLQLLKYHHISPCFLSFLSSFGRNPLTGDNDLFFGGFRSSMCLASPVGEVSIPERSGFYYQLTFELRSLWLGQHFGQKFTDNSYRTTLAVPVCFDRFIVRCPVL
jgi:hypothetical protein